MIPLQKQAEEHYEKYPYGGGAEWGRLSPTANKISTNIFAQFDWRKQNSYFLIEVIVVYFSEK